MRADVNKGPELARAEKRFWQSPDAKVTLYVLRRRGPAFRELMRRGPGRAVHSLEAVIVRRGRGRPGENFDGLTVKVDQSALPRCERCWTHSDTVGLDAEHPTLCARCAAAIR